MAFRSPRRVPEIGFQFDAPDPFAPCFLNERAILGSEL